jgi:hypothetical protein
MLWHSPQVLRLRAFLLSRLKPLRVMLSMIHHRRFSEMTPFRPRHSRCLLRLSVAGRRIVQAHRLGPGSGLARCSTMVLHNVKGRLTSISTKLGVGSSSSVHQPVVIAPVALPGLTKNLPSISYASNLCVPPQSRTSTSICRAAISKLSPSPGGMIVCPCVKPIRSEPCVTTFDSARLGASTSKSPLTICRSGAMARRNS